VASTQTPSRSGDQQTGRIRGGVVAAETGAPLPGARVVVWNGETQPREITTDPDGRYEVEQLPAAEYFVTAAHTGYLTAAYGQQRLRPMENGTAVTVGAGQTVERIDLALPRGGMITVRVTDHLGEPLAGALLHVQRFVYAANGQRQLTNVATGIRGQATTDDRGEVRALGLMPGEYVIRANVRSIRPANAAISNVTEGFAPTYYPGTTNSREAQVVSLGLSEERTVPFAMMASRLSRVSGTVFMSTGLPAARMDLQLGPGEGDGGLVYGAGSVAADGTFTITGVPRGNYTVRVRQDARARYKDIGRAGEAGVPVRRIRGEFASVEVMVGDEDITGLRIITGPGTTISGRVVFEGASPRPSINELRVFALPPGLAGGGWFAMGSSVYDFPPEGSVAADGRFQITGASGRVQLDLQTEGWTLKSVALEGRDVTDETLDLTAVDAVSGVELTLTDKVSSVAGEVRDSDGQLMRSCVVIVLPRDVITPAASSRWIHASRPAPNGHFKIPRLRPGTYVAAAVDWIEQGRQFAPEFQQLLRRRAREFSVGEGQSLTLDLTLTPDL